MKTIQIPFPLLEGVRDTNQFLRAIVARGTELGLKSHELPQREILPRSFRWSEHEEIVGSPTIKFSLWGGYNGFYVRGTLQGYCGYNGTYWGPAALEVRFRPFLGPGYGEKTFSLKMDATVIDAVLSRKTDPEAANAALDAVLAELTTAVEAAKAAEVARQTECSSREGDEYAGLYQ